LLILSKPFRKIPLGLALLLFLQEEIQAHPDAPDLLPPTTVSAAADSRMSFSEEVVVTGTVVDAQGQPIPGVTVSVSGTTTGTATDMDGEYRLSVPERATLVFSFIGFETQNIAIGDRT